MKLSNPTPENIANYKMLTSLIRNAELLMEVRRHPHLLKLIL